jgi:hypothetical protein
MSSPTDADGPQEIEGWFDKLRISLFEVWTSKTGHGLTGPINGWACEIGRGCRSCSDHLSIPCSLATEAHEIAVFLNKPWDQAEFILFFRLYLVILSEFVCNLEGIAKKVGVEIGSPPVNVRAWANNYAKHRQCILLQHHPFVVEADAFGPDWPKMETALQKKEYMDGCGVIHSLEIIDQNWFGSERKHDTIGANSNRQAVIVIPPLMGFLEDTMTYFRSLVDACGKQPDLVKQFESAHYSARCR